MKENDRETIELKRKNNKERALRLVQVNKTKKPATRKKTFVPLDTELHDNRDFRINFMPTKKFQIYMWLKRNIIRKSNGRSIQRDIVYQEYWRKGLLSTHISLDNLSRDLKIPTTTLRSQIWQMEVDGILMVDTVQAGEFENKKRFNVLILGVGSWKDQHRFINDVFCDEPRCQGRC